MGLCVEQTITTREVGGCQWTEVKRVVFVLNPYTAVLKSAADRVPQHCCRYSAQSTGCSTLPGSYTTISAFCHWAPWSQRGGVFKPCFSSAKTANIWFLRAGTVGEQSVAIAKAATILPYCRDKRRSFQYKYTWIKVYKYNKICLQWALDCKQMNENFISNGNRPPSSPPRFSLSWYPPKWSHPKLWFWTSDSRRENCLKCWENKWKQHKKGRWGGGREKDEVSETGVFLSGCTDGDRTAQLTSVNSSIFLVL